MPLSPGDIDRIAAAYDEAERTRRQIRQISLDRPEITLDEAYAIQRAWVTLKLARGHRPTGRKIGLTSRAMQRASRIDEPDYGILLDHMMIEDGATIAADRFIQPRMEIEIGFRLKAPLEGPDVDVFDVMNATDQIASAFEIIDARCHSVDPDTGRPRLVQDTISDNAANAGVVIGGRSARPDALDMRWIPGALYQNGQVEETGVALGVLGHPARGVAWLARRLAAHGEGLRAGEFILSGSFTRPVFAAPGDVFHADFGPLGQVTCSFAKENAE